MASTFALRALATAALLALPATAQGESRLEAHYTLSVARIPLGAVAWTVEVDAGSYGAAATGAARGVLRIITSGTGTLTTRGLIRDGRPVPALFTADMVSDGETSRVKMALDNGDVKDLAIDAPAHKDRVPVTEAHRRGVIDPLTAMLAPAGRTGDVVSAAPCERTLPIFDGARRFDLKLSFKRFDVIKLAQGYQGTGVICAMAFQAVAGHRATSPLVGYLSGGRDMEIWLAPLAGTRLLAPVRLSISNMLGDLVLAADRFDVTVSPDPRPGGASAGTR